MLKIRENQEENEAVSTNENIRFLITIITIAAGAEHTPLLAAGVRQRNFDFFGFNPFISPITCLPLFCRHNCQLSIWKFSHQRLRHLQILSHGDCNRSNFRMRLAANCNIPSPASWVKLQEGLFSAPTTIIKPSTTFKLVSDIGQIDPIASKDGRLFLQQLSIL